MNANRLGKALVLVNLAGSFLFMAWAMAIYFQKVDWGWKEPRKDVTATTRIPSEIDQRAAAVSTAHEAIALVMPDLKKAQLTLAEAEPRLADNHLWYRQELAKLRSDPGPIEVKQFKISKEGAVVLDPPGKPIGRPVLADPLAELNKSYDGFTKDLKDIHEKIDKAGIAIRDLVAKEKALTFKLNGLDDAGKLVQSGLYALLDKEAKLQEQFRFEMKYLEPHWVGALADVDLFLERRLGLEATLERLKKARAGK